MANGSTHRCSLSSLLLVFLVCPLPLVTPLNFSFDFTGSAGGESASGIVLEGDAVPSSSGIQLTKNFMSQDFKGSAGRVLYPDSLRLWNAASGDLLSFTTHFSFKMSKFPNTTGGDGIAFFLAPLSELPDIAGSGGENLGLFNNSANKVVAVEFDSYHNYFDPTDGMDHIGVDVYSIRSIAFSSMVNFNFSNVSYTPVATVAYDGRAMNLTVLLTFSSVDPSVNDRTWTMSRVVDLKRYLPKEVAMGFSASTGKSAEGHSILSWDFNSTVLEIRSPTPAPEIRPLEKVTREKVGSKVNLGVVIGAAVLVGAMALAWFGLWCYWRGKQRRRPVDKVWRGPRMFRYEDLAAATLNFAEERKLGEGGFGAVYKGVLEANNTYTDVAIKKTSIGSMQREKQYLTEVTLFSQLRHRNLVNLIGYCQEGGGFLLVYQYMPNRSLDKHLYDPNTVLGWAQRYKIAQGLAAALLYLHEECEQCVLHRDIKPSNVMLDMEFNAKLGDFGLAKLFEHDLSAVTTILAGTKGYIAPEYGKTGRARRESDVYSFGVAALEIACGRRLIELMEESGQINLIEWVWELYERRACLEAIDPKLGSELEEREVEALMVVGLWCAHPDYSLRPSIRRAIDVLRFVTPLPELQHPRATRRQEIHDASASSAGPSFNDQSTSSRSAFSQVRAQPI